MTLGFTREPSVNPSTPPINYFNDGETRFRSELLRSIRIVVGLGIGCALRSRISTLFGKKNSAGSVTTVFSLNASRASQPRRVYFDYAAKWLRRDTRFQWKIIKNVLETLDIHYVVSINRGGAGESIVLAALRKAQSIEAL